MHEEMKFKKNQNFLHVITNKFNFPKNVKIQCSRFVCELENNINCMILVSH